MKSKKGMVSEKEESRKADVVRANSCSKGSVESSPSENTNAKIVDDIEKTVVGNWYRLIYYRKGWKKKFRESWRTWKKLNLDGIDSGHTIGFVERPDEMVTENDTSRLIDTTRRCEELIKDIEKYMETNEEVKISITREYIDENKELSEDNAGSIITIRKLKQSLSQADKPKRPICELCNKEIPLGDWDFCDECRERREKEALKSFKAEALIVLEKCYDECWDENIEFDKVWETEPERVLDRMQDSISIFYDKAKQRISEIGVKK